jgi:hypothetical protein
LFKALNNKRKGETGKKGQGDEGGERGGLVVDMLLARRSLYRLSGVARYRFRHSILGGGAVGQEVEEKSCFGGQPVPRDRRISIILRELPPRKRKQQQQKEEETTKEGQESGDDNNVVRLRPVPAE